MLSKVSSFCKFIYTKALHGVCGKSGKKIVLKSEAKLTALSISNNKERIQKNKMGIPDMIITSQGELIDFKKFFSEGLYFSKEYVESEIRRSKNFGK